MWGTIKVTFDRGRHYVGYPSFLMMLHLTLRSFNMTLGREYLLIMFLALGIIGLVGWLDIHFKTYESEQEYYNKIEPFRRRVLEILEDLAKREGRKP